MLVLVTDYLLDDLALLDDTLQLFHDEGAYPHWLTARDDTIKTIQISVVLRKKGWGGVWCPRAGTVKTRTLFADERVVPVVRIVRVAKSSMRIFKFEKLVAMLARMTRTFKFFVWLEGKICTWYVELRGGNRAMKCVLVSVTRCEYAGHGTRDEGVYLR